MVTKILPISRIIVETASFDIQKIKNPDISGVEYQQGEQMGNWNVREYVLWRDGHTCQYCKGKSKDPILNTHHLQSRKIGGDAPNNLITLCKTCHDRYHKDEILLKVKRGKSFRDAAFMGIMRWTVYNRLKEMYPDVKMTYGYITKTVRIDNKLPKGHIVDARCISGHPLAQPRKDCYLLKPVRRHNRQLHRATINKGGTRKVALLPKYVFGYQNWDKVTYAGKECFITARTKGGYFTLRRLTDDTVKTTRTYKKIKLLERRKGLLVERRPQVVHDSETAMQEVSSTGTAA